MRISWKASILQMAESDIFFVNGGAYEDGSLEYWL